MKSVKITVYSDYVCPWCFMAHTSLKQVKAELPVEIDWRAFELRPAEERGHDEAAMEEKRKQIAAFWPTVKQIARERYGLDIEQGPWGIDTRLAHVGAKAAEEFGAGEAFRRELFERYWKKSEDVGSRDVLLDIALGLGLDAQAFAARLDDPGLLRAVLDDEQTAARIGVRGVPAMIIDWKYLISGAQTKDVLVRALSEYLEKGSISSK